MNICLSSTGPIEKIGMAAIHTEELEGSRALIGLGVKPVDSLGPFFVSLPEMLRSKRLHGPLAVPLLVNIYASNLPVCSFGSPKKHLASFTTFVFICPREVTCVRLRNDRSRRFRSTQDDIL